MSPSKEEEIIGALWAIASLLAFSNGYTGWGWLFAVMSGLAIVLSIGYIYIKGLRNKLKRKDNE